MPFIQRFITDPKRTLTRSRSATDATRFLRHIQARLSPAIPWDNSTTNSKRQENIEKNSFRTRSQSVPINSSYR